ncbi:MAG: hypothetical protein KF888_06370 [Nitrosomonas sp.]|nr:hypothetical protein [Nitrosomonas sp.]
MGCQLSALWKKCFANGEITGVVWAALMHQRVSDKTRGKFYGGIHMHAHQTGTGQVNLNSEVIESTEIIMLNNYKLQLFFQKS